KEIEGILNNIESQWNAHDIKAVMANYADDYYNNDGLDKKAVQKLTEDFWKTYPDAHSVSRTKEIRVDGNFATVESRDTATGTTKMKDMNSLGELQSVSEGQQYLKRLGNVWKIIGDRIDYEKVKVAFGLAKHLNASFTAPEQVKAGKLYAAKLEVNLPPGLHAVGSITNQPLVFPQKSPQEKTRRLGSSSDEPDQTPVLERVMSANKDNHNELLSATVILVNPNNSVMGVSLMTRRLNVVPDQPEIKDDTTTAANPSDDADKVADSSTKAGEEPAKGEVEKAKPEASKDEKPKAETEKEKLEEGYKNSPPSK
ncbi:MAG: nuclear transport factor 2 family protein, partial [Cyanobacteria bacterium SZAS LIN-2]|nr:nuclear transport factor 2 family protein [Cyanobacteria bacterium SZAS LIN-2]